MLIVHHDDALDRMLAHMKRICRVEVIKLQALANDLSGVNNR